MQFRHNAFNCTSQTNIKIQTLSKIIYFLNDKSRIKKLSADPFNDKVGYPVPNVEVDYVTVSHQHYDHNSIYVLNQNFKKATVIRT